MYCPKPIRRKSYAVCSGDLNETITVFQRELVPVDEAFSMNAGQETSLAAMVDVISGSRRLNGVNQDDNATHTFYVNHVLPIDTSWSVRYDGSIYRIMEVSKLANGRFLLLKCRDMGIDTAGVSFQ